MFITNERPTGAASFEWFDERLETNIFYFSPVAAALMRPLIEEVGGWSARLLSLLIGLCSLTETNRFWKDCNAPLGTEHSWAQDWQFREKPLLL